MIAAAGFSEELFFRGVVQNMIENSSSFPIALVIASSIYGLIHIPLFGSNAVEKGLLGAAMGYAYYISGHNLAVPIAMHTVYDAVTGFITWNVAKNDLNTRMLTAVKNEVKRIQTVSSSEIDELSAAVSDLCVGCINRCNITYCVFIILKISNSCTISKSYLSYFCFISSLSYLSSFLLLFCKNSIITITKIINNNTINIIYIYSR